MPMVTKLEMERCPFVLSAASPNLQFGLNMPNKKKTQMHSHDWKIYRQFSVHSIDSSDVVPIETKKRIQEVYECFMVLLRGSGERLMDDTVGVAR